MQMSPLSAKDCKIKTFSLRFCFWAVFLIVPRILWHKDSLFVVLNEEKSCLNVIHDKQGVFWINLTRTPPSSNTFGVYGEMGAASMENRYIRLYLKKGK